ncbi:TPA: SGNH/GDSL hydrolase family protein [Escherichia coli]|nr:SGNH/GDSL hydrolase family protein [Escherichia coli]
MVTDRLAGKEILATLGSVSTPAQMSGTNTLRFRIGDFGSEAEINLRTDSSVNDRRGGVVKLISVPAATSQKNIRVLMIGDSIGNRQGPLLLSQFLSNYGFTVQFIGTLNTSASASAAGDATGELAECREGWESGDFTGAVTDRISIIQPGDEATYLSQSKADKAPQNPFLRAATSADPADSVRNGYVMDFAFYQSRFSLDAPDVVIYSTGTNDVRDRPASTIYDDVLSNELLLLRQLRSAWPAAKIIRMLPGTSMDPQRNALWTSGYAPVLRAIAASATTLADGGLIIAPTWALVNHDCGYSASYTETDPDTGFGRLNWSDKVHPVRASRQLLYKSLAPYVAATFLNLI